MRVILLASLLTPLLATAETASQPACPTLARATFTTAVINREPSDSVTQVSAETSELFFYTEVKNGGSQTLHHHWFLNDQSHVDVSLKIGSDSWRTWSSKTLTGLDLKAGDRWTVSVSGAQGCELGQWQVELTDANKPNGGASDRERSAPATEKEPTQPQANHEEPADLSAHLMVIEELLNLGDSRGARSAIKRAKALTHNPKQLAELDQMEQDNQAFAALNQLIRQRDIAAARQKLQTLMSSVPPHSPVYPALQGRHNLLDQLYEMNRTNPALQAASAP